MPFHALLPADARGRHSSRYCSVVVQDVAAVVQDAGCYYCYDCCCMVYYCRGDEDGGVVAVALLQEREFPLWWLQICR